MSLDQVNRWKTELIDWSFAPRRAGLAVRKIRRVLWPFIRPYHFYTLERLGEVADRAAGKDKALDELREELGGAGATLRHRLEALEEREQALRAAQERFADTQAHILADAARRRDDAGLVSAELARLRSDLAAAINRQLAMETETAAFRAGQESAATAAAAERAVLDARTKLWFAPTRHGLFLLKHGDYISDAVAGGQLWDAHIVRVIEEVARTGRAGCAIDAGAHLGTLTAIMARHFAQVISFEPNSINHAVLTANCALNRLDNVRCLNQALFSRETELSLGRPDQQEVPMPLDSAGGLGWADMSNLGALLFTTDGSGVFPTRATPLDSLALPALDFIKIDAQGADGEIILGAAETLRRCRPVIVFEWENLLARNFSAGLDEVMALLHGLGYQVEILHTHNEKQVDYIARPADQAP